MVFGVSGFGVKFFIDSFLVKRIEGESLGLVFKGIFCLLVDYSF